MSLCAEVRHCFDYWNITNIRFNDIFSFHFFLVDLGFNGPLKQYFSLYRAVSQRKGEREKKG